MIKRSLSISLALLLTSQVMWGSNAFVQINHQYSYANLTFSTTSGNFLFVSCTWNGTTETPTIDNARDTWNTITKQAATVNGVGMTIAAFYAMNVGSGSQTITVSSLGSDAGCNAQEFSGVATSAAGDVVATLGQGAGGTTTTPATGTLSPTAGALIVAVFADEGTGASTFTAGTGYIIPGHGGTCPGTACGEDNTHVDAVEYKLSASSGSQTAGLTLGTASNTWIMGAYSFLSAGGAAVTLVKKKMVGPF